MHPSFALLAQALRDRIAVIADREFYQRDPAAHLAALQSASERITTHAAELPRPLDGDFAHYLQRSSYAKALEWLDSRGV